MSRTNTHPAVGNDEDKLDSWRADLLKLRDEHANAEEHRSQLLVELEQSAKDMEATVNRMIVRNETMYTYIVRDWRIGYIPCPYQLAFRITCRCLYHSVVLYFSVHMLISFSPNLFPQLQQLIDPMASLEVRQKQLAHASKKVGREPIIA